MLMATAVSRSWKWLVLVAIVVVALGGLAVMIATSLPEPPEPEKPVAAQSGTAAGVAPDPAAEGTIADEAETVAFLIQASSSGWAAHITGTEVITLLRRPVIVVSTDIGPEQAGLSDEFASGLSSFIAALTTNDGAPYTYYVQVRSAEGDVIGSISATDDRWALDAPAAPVDVDSLRSWLDAVYGTASPQPETWFARIAAIEVDSDGNIVVHTDLGPDSVADQQVAQTIIDSVNSSGAAFAPGVRVLFGDGTFEWSALLDGIDPYGPQS